VPPGHEPPAERNTVLMGQAGGRWCRGRTAGHPKALPAAIRELLQAVGLLAGDSGDEIEVLIDVED